MHPKYRLPADCFAYVSSAASSKTWHPPYLLAHGTPDMARLPKAIHAILSNYRGVHVGSVPEATIPEVLVTLARAARQLGKLPANGPGTPRHYVQPQEALEWGKMREPKWGPTCTVTELHQATSSQHYPR